VEPARGELADGFGAGTDGCDAEIHGGQGITGAS
jgi:hypothetical protein